MIPHKVPTDISSVSRLQKKSILGEGISISLDHQTLAWVDVLGHSVHLLDLPSGDYRVVENFSYPSCTLQPEKDWVYISHIGGIDRINLNSLKSEHCAKWFSKVAGLRCNDATVDHIGNFWLSTMAINEQLGAGAIWFWDRKSEVRKVIDGLSIPNAMAIHPTTSHLYYCDSIVGEIKKCKIDQELGLMGDEQTFLPRLDGLGVPDGLHIDENGSFWNARWDGSAILHLNNFGQIISQIDLPFSRPTSITNLNGNKLFVTFASKDLVNPVAEVLVLTV